TDMADGRPLPLVITTGSAEENRKLVAQHGIHCPVLRDASPMEVAARYQAHGTPMGYLIDEQGQIASDLAVGAQALLALAAATAAPAPCHPPGGTAPGGERKRPSGAAGQPRSGGEQDRPQRSARRHPRARLHRAGARRRDALSGGLSRPAGAAGLLRSAMRS